MLSRTVDKDGLIKLLEPPVTAFGYQLVDLDTHTGGRSLLRVYIDREPEVTLSDCEFLSRQLSAFLDVENPLSGSYVLEVSSPGADRKLRTLEHFERFLGQDVKIDLKEAQDGRRLLRGTLMGVEGNEILLNLDGTLLRLDLSEIETARLVP
ncbi:MAG: ribosome maturation factor RimP [Gammaproteobacteria bacterium]